MAESKLVLRVGRYWAFPPATNYLHDLSIGYKSNRPAQGSANLAEKHIYFSKER